MRALNTEALRERKSLLEWGVSLRRKLNLPSGEHEAELKKLNNISINHDSKKN